VQDVFEYLAGGMTEDQILEDFPELTREDINACFAFAADRERKLFVAAGVKLLLDENLSDRIISRVADLFPDSTHRFSSKGYCVWPPAEVHMATRRELQDWPDHESSEIALSGYSAVY
jgi:hypothetical protein